MMRILTWNINGIRACKQPFTQDLADLGSDIVCLQETKITRDLLDEETAIQDGYNSYFSFSKKKSGYSGVATYCKTHATPVCAEEGLSGILTDKMKGAPAVIGHYGDLSEFTNEELMSLDTEGRAILTEHWYRDTSGSLKQLVVINVYCPRADPDREGRLNYKLQFYKLLQIRAEALLKANKVVIILGDFNVTHKPIDHCDPDGDEERFYARRSRQWLDALLVDTITDFSKRPDRKAREEKKKFVDTFRYFHPKQESAFTCWSTVTGARQTNYGTRIDYIVSDVRLCQEEFVDCEILQDFEGSDHCPVRAVLKGSTEPCDKLPSICTKFMPEFQGKQQKLSTFFVKALEKDKSAETSATRAIGCTSARNSTLLGKRTFGKSEYEPSSKKAKTDLKRKNKKSVSITSFFKRVQPDNQVALKQNLDDKQHQVSASYVDDVNKKYFRDEVSQLVVSKDTGDKKEGSLGNISESADSPKDVNVSGIGTTRPKKQMASSWKDILKGLPPAPLCKGHREPCLLRTVKKPGPNLGKKFYVCCKPKGHRSNPDARCGHFEWVVSTKQLKDVKSGD